MGGRGSGGHNRLPTSEKELLGTLRPARERAYRERDAAAGLGEPVGPPDEDLSTAEQEWWQRLAAAVGLAGTYCEARRPEFRNMVRMQTLLEQSLSGERMDEGKDGAPRAVPVASITSMVRLLAALFKQFSSPSARIRQLPGPAPANPDADDPDDLSRYVT